MVQVVDPLLMRLSRFALVQGKIFGMKEKKMLAVEWSDMGPVQ